MIVINSDYFKIELIINKKAHLFNPYKIITFDTEAKRYKTNYGEKHIFFNLDLFDGKEHYYTENKNEIIDLFYLLIKKYKRLSFFAHNITYDIRILDLLIKLLNDKFIDYFNKVRVLDKVFYVKFTSRKRDYVINFIDSMNYFKTSLSRLSNNYGVKKVNEDEYKLEPKEWNKQLLIDGKERVMKDTEILYTVLESFFNMPFKFGITLASTSFNTYKMNFMPTKITFPISLSKFALESYKGGIVLPYKLTRNKYLRDYDINSLYPKVMRDNLYSYKFKKELTNFKYIYDDIKNKSYNYLVYCSWSGKGYTPVYVKYDNQLIPFLSASGWITGNELLALYENGFNIMLYKIYEFYNTDLFSNFIETYYDLRKNTTKEYERDFYKLIMNSLYGKFGQNKGHSELILIDDIENKMIKEVIKESDSEKIIINGKTYINTNLNGDIIAKNLKIGHKRFRSYYKYINKTYDKKVDFVRASKEERKEIDTNEIKKDFKSGKTIEEISKKYHTRKENIVKITKNFNKEIIETHKNKIYHKNSFFVKTYLLFYF